MNKNTALRQQHLFFVDWLRLAACFMVMLVHASENFYGADNSGLAGNVSMLANESNRFWVAFYDGGIGRTCVPLFMVVSAFLLVPLKEGTTMIGFYKRRFLRVIPPMVIFSLLYCLLPLVWGGMDWEQSVTDLKNLPFNFPSMAGHLWFMYPLISLYLIMPVVSPWLVKASAQEERIFIALFALSTCIPWLHRFVRSEVWGECFWNHFHMLWYCSGYLGYLVLAHYIRVHLTWGYKKKLVIGALCFLIGSSFTAWSFWMEGTPGQLIETPVLEWSWEFCTPNLLISTFGAFLMFSCIPNKYGSPALTKGGQLTFGMYLMHMFFLAPIATWITGGHPETPLIPVWIAIPSIALLTYLICLLTTRLISCLPGSRWIIG